MQSNKASKKTKSAEETVPASAETKTTGEVTAKPRTSKSSKPKSEPAETSSAKRHRKATPIGSPEKAAAIEHPTPSFSSAIDPVGLDVVVPVVTTETIETITVRTVTHSQIAHLAHSYWVERGQQHGSPEEDWLRAERELASAGRAKAAHAK